MIEWPLQLAQSLQRGLIENNVTDPQALLDVFKQQGVTSRLSGRSTGGLQKEWMSSEFFGALLPQQPGLLAVLTFFGIATAIFLVLLLAFTAARCFGCFGAELYQKHPADRSSFLGLAAGVGVFWFLLALALFFIVSCTLHLSGGRGNAVVAEEIPIDVRRLNKSAFRPVKITLQSISISNLGRTDRAPVGEADLLNKYNAIRELGYEFRPLERDADFRTQVIVFTTIALVFAALLAISGTTTIVGCREFLFGYHPMDRSKSSNCCGRALVASAFTLLALVPLLLVISGFVLAYVQAHNSLCPFVQAESQNENIEGYVNANFEFFDAYNLLDFLNDLQSERAEINCFNCEAFSRPLQGVWLGLLLLVLFALPLAAILLRISRYFLRMSSQFYWNPSAIETYNTLQREKTPLPASPYHSVFPVPRY